MKSNLKKLEVITNKGSGKAEKKRRRLKSREI